MRQNIDGFLIKQNDTLPALKINVKSRTYLDSLVPFVLSGVSTCTFSMSDNSGNLKIASSPAQILCVSGGTIQYNWNLGDTDTSGNYIGEFQLNFISGGTMTIPTLDGINISVIKSVNG